MTQFPYLILKQKLLAAVAELKEVDWYKNQDTPDLAGGIRTAPAVYIQFLPYETRSLTRGVQSANIELDVHIISDCVYEDDKRVKAPTDEPDHHTLANLVHKAIDGSRGKLSDLEEYVELLNTPNDHTVFNSITRISVPVLAHQSKSIMKTVMRYRFHAKDLTAATIFTSPPEESQPIPLTITTKDIDLTLEL